VAFLTPAIAPVVLRNADLPAFDQVKGVLARFAILDGIDADAEILAAPDPVKGITVDTDQLVPLLKRAKLSDRDIRRYVVRRAYDEYSRATLTDPVSFDSGDYTYTGATHQDFLRCAQLLEEEGYLHVKLITPHGALSVLPTAKLVRALERFGAASEDVVSATDYEATLRAYPSIQPCEKALLAERGRYEAASTPAELLSVFRATAPIVESIVRDLLGSHGSKKAYPTLGPMIADLHSRGIAGIGVISQLENVLKFGRDMAQHGESLPMSVLRIVCENAFELVPQLAALFS
jgi:hypothetical protein